MADTDSGTSTEAPPAPEAAPEPAILETASSPEDDLAPTAEAPAAKAEEPTAEASAKAEEPAKAEASARAEEPAKAEEPTAEAPAKAEPVKAEELAAKAEAPKSARPAKAPKADVSKPAPGPVKADAEKAAPKPANAAKAAPKPAKAEPTPAKGVSDRLTPPKGVSDRQTPAKGVSGRHVAAPEKTPVKGVSGRHAVVPERSPAKKSDTARKARAAAPASAAPRGAYVAAAVIVGAALLVVAALALTGNSKRDTPPLEQAAAPAPVSLPALPSLDRPRGEDPAASWSRLNALQEQLAEATAPTPAELERFAAEHAALRASGIGREAAGALDRVEKRLAELRTAKPAAPPTDAKGADAKAKLASIDAGLEELAFAVEARLSAALASLPRNLLLVMAEEQQGRGARERLKKVVREAKASPRALIDVALRPEWVGLLGSSGYQAIEDWAEQYLGAFAGSEAFVYWQTTHRPRLAETLERARKLEAALAKVEAAWKARDHAAGLAALAAYKDARTDVWGPALLAWVEQPETAQVWGALPLRPEELHEDAPRGRDDPPPPAQRGSGTGFFVESHLILTNAHVVGTATEVTVQLQGKPDAKGKVLARDAALDLALVEVPGLDGQPLALCKDSISVGESVYVYGYGAMVSSKGMLTNDQAVWTEGSLSQVQQDDARRLLVVTAAVNPGNSGGPLVDCGGNWIGVVVAKTRSEGFIEGYGLAIHGEDAMAWIRGQKARNGFKTTAAPKSPLRPSAIAKKLPVSVVRIVVG